MALWALLEPVGLAPGALPAAAPWSTMCEGPWPVCTVSSEPSKVRHVEGEAADPQRTTPRGDGGASALMDAGQGLQADTR